eukprot:m.250187 g.250187  ORF g.250187 m.250187 type:complete len:286 (-) comp76760_c0_seq1:125-982(-)
MNSASANAASNTLEHMCVQLEDLLARQAAASADARPPMGTVGALLSTPWIVRWLDYSQRYGLGYELSDGTTGALLNDGAMVAAPPSCSFVWHWEREGQSALRIHREHHRERTVAGVAAFGYLEELMRTHLDGLDRPLTATRRSIAEYLLAPPSRPVRWLRLPGATIFRYNTNVLQVDFSDSTRLVVDFMAEVVALGDEMTQVGTLMHYGFEMIAISAPHPVLIARLTFLVELLRQHVRVFERESISYLPSAGGNTCAWAQGNSETLAALMAARQSVSTGRASSSM